MTYRIEFLQPALAIVAGEPLPDAPSSTALTIARYARDQTTRWGASEALVYHDAHGEVRWSYRDLWEHSLKVARALAADGVGKGARVGVLLSNRPEYIAAIFGIAMAGGIVVALNTFATPHELDQLLEASAVEVLIYERHIARRDFSDVLTGLEPAFVGETHGKPISTRYPFLRRLIVIGAEGDPPRCASLDWGQFLRLGDGVPDGLVEARIESASPSDTAALFFSSGSTGLPKGIVHTQRAVVVQWRQWAAAMGFSGAVRVWTANGFFWSGNFAMAIGSALSSGGALVLQSTFDAAEAIGLMQRERVDAPMAQVHQWGRMADEPAFQTADFSAFRFMDPHYSGVEQATIPDGYTQPQAFGCTETLTINTATRFGSQGFVRPDGHGWPLPGNTLKIVDPLTGDIVPIGERGEIAVKGPTLMAGYLGKSVDECFDAEGFYRTGDGGYLDETGWLFWEGRLTDIIKTGGANVSPREIDAVLAAHPDIKTTQTVGVPHDMLGEMIVSCVVPLEGRELVSENLQVYLKERVASYKVPRRIFVLTDEEMTLTGSGNKIKAAEVRTLAIERLAAEAAGTSI